jgi:hypothetical protein
MPRRDSKRGSHDEMSRRPTLNVGLFLSHVVRFRSITGQSGAADKQSAIGHGP